MRKLLPLLLIVVMSGCSDSEPAVEPVVENKTEAPPIQKEPDRSHDPVPKAAPPQTSPAVPSPTPAVTRPDPPAVVEKPEPAPFQAPGKVPLLVTVRTKSGKKHVGEVLERTDSGLVLYDIVLRGTITIPKDQTKSIIEGIDERQAGFHVPFATYGAWKLTKLLRAGKVQGQITVASEQGLFINLGSTAGLVAGQTIKLLGQAESIIDPETEKVLAVFRPTLATLLVSQVMNADLSKVTLNSPESSVSIERGMVVECERLPRTVVLIPPQWESADPNLKTGDEALYLTEHVLTELVRYDVPVISQDQVSRLRAEIASRESQAKESVSGIAIAEEVQADVVLTGKLLAKGQTGNVTLHVTDVPTTRSVGVLTGRIRRDKIKDESEQAKKVAVVVMKGGNRTDVLARRIGITPAMAGSLLLAMPFDQETVRVTGRTIQVRDISAYNRHGIGSSATIATVEEGVRADALSFRSGSGIVIDGRLFNGRSDYTIALWFRGNGHRLINEYHQPNGIKNFKETIFNVRRFDTMIETSAWHQSLAKNWYTGKDKVFPHPRTTAWEFLAFRVSDATVGRGHLRITSDQKHFDGGTQMVYRNHQADRGFVTIGCLFQRDQTMVVELDEVFFFDRSLSDEEIGVLYARGAVETGKSPDTIKTDSE